MFYIVRVYVDVCHAHVIDDEPKKKKRKNALQCSAVRAGVEV